MKQTHLIGLAALLIGALAVTPTLQLRARAIAAGETFESLHGRAAPAVAQRDQIVQQAEKATAIRDHLAAQADPVKVLEALTRATPDDAWILSLKVEGLTASLTGNAANAAALMRQLRIDQQLLQTRPAFLHPSRKKLPLPVA